MKTPQKLYMRLLPIFGLVLILIGYLYFGYKLIQIRDEVKHSKIELKSLEKNKEQKSLEILELEKSLESLNKLINQSKNNLLIEKATDITNSAQTALNVINTQFIEPTSKIIYIQVNDENTEKILMNVGLVDNLKPLGAKVYGYDIEEGRADNSIRYFHDSDKLFAENTQKLLSEKFQMALKIQRVKGFENKVKKGQIELWIKIN